MRTALALALLMAASLVAAETVYRWVDKEGGVHYTDKPPLPAEARSIEQKGVHAPAGGPGALPYLTQKAAADFPATVHTTPDCTDACKQGRDHLAKRGVPFSEKSVATPEDIAALRTLVGGEGPLLVPVLQVGGKVVKGYRQADWDSLLDAAGYPKAGLKPGGTGNWRTNCSGQC